MGFIYALRSEQEKTKHTSFWAIHFCVPVMGALLFLAYYSLYASTADSKKLKMILEITTTFFPLLISVIVGLHWKKKLHTSKRCLLYQTDTKICLQN